MVIPQAYSFTLHSTSRNSIRLSPLTQLAGLFSVLLRPKASNVHTVSYTHLTTFSVSLSLGTSLPTLPVPISTRIEFRRFFISPISFSMLTVSLQPVSKSIRTRQNRPPMGY